MRITVVSFVVGLLILLGGNSARAQGWRSIVPLHSTRADVERLLGPPTESSGKFSVWYKLTDESVNIRYSEGLPCGIGEKYSQWRVPENTVVSVYVTLRPVPLSHLGIDTTKYKKRSGGHLPEDIYYISGEDGMSIRVLQGEVQDINYYPASADVALACPGVRTSSEPDCEGLSPPRFKSYGLEQLQFERSLLDSFAIAILEDENRIGYLIAYAGKRARAGEANAWAQRTKKYLMTVRHIPEGRLKALDGGYRETAEIDLFIVGGRQCPPIPRPTIDPRDVEILSPPPGR